MATARTSPLRHASRVPTALRRTRRPAVPAAAADDDVTASPRWAWSYELELILFGVYALMVGVVVGLHLASLVG